MTSQANESAFCGPDFLLRRARKNIAHCETKINHTRGVFLSETCAHTISISIYPSLFVFSRSLSLSPSLSVFLLFSARAVRHLALARSSVLRICFWAQRKRMVPLQFACRWQQLRHTTNNIIEDVAMQAHVEHAGNMLGHTRTHQVHSFRDAWDRLLGKGVMAGLGCRAVTPKVRPRITSL